jgi:hypothetical protein
VFARLNAFRKLPTQFPRPRQYSRSACWRRLTSQRAAAAPRRSDCA